jgi:hypothetical protein
MLVPELVRLPRAISDADGRDKFEQFYYIELSEECVEMICKYKLIFPELFSFLEKLSEDKLKYLKSIKSSELFGDPEKAK